jgi:hypothetical protein
LKRLIAYLIISLFPILCLKAQIEFQRGYYVDNHNDTIQCEIKNKGWSFIPESFTIRNIDNSETYKILTEEIKLLKISNKVKFVKILVQEDISDNNPEKIALDKNIEYTETERFLRVLVESKYSLYVAEEGRFKKFFYTDQNGIVRQLVNKRYYIKGKNVTNSQEYIKQLLRINECQNSELNNFVFNNKLSELNLIYYFEQINSCADDEIIIFEEKTAESKSKINYSLKLGFSNTKSKYTSTYSNSSESILFPSSSTFMYGVEIEFPIKINKNKWSLIFEPTFKRLESSTTVIDQRIERTYEFQVNTLDIPIGIRYKFYLSDDFNIFLTLKPQYTVILGNSYIDFDFGQSFEPETKFNTSIGAGLKWKKIMFEYRRDSQDLMNQEVFKELINYHNAFIIGYTFL